MSTGSRFGIPNPSSAQLLVQYCYQKVVRSLSVRPSTSGNVSIVQSLVLLGTVAASCTVLGHTKRWIQVDPLLSSSLQQAWSNGYDCAPTDDQEYQQATTTTTRSAPNTNRIALTTTPIGDTDNKSNVDSRTFGIREKMLELSQLCLRVFFVPSLCEEILWRCLLLPQPIPNTKRSIFYILLINSFYTLSHVIHAKGLSLLLFHSTTRQINNSNSSDGGTKTSNCSNESPPPPLPLFKPTMSDSIEKTMDVFTDPSFLLVTFLLGNACSYSYIKAGYGLYAPVLIHTISVSIWLTFLGGNQALGRM